MKKDPRVFLIHILENAALAQVNLKDFDFDRFIKNKAIQDAVVREIEIIGEATKNLPLEFKDRHPEIPWQKIAGMRNKIVHNYFDIDFKVVWNTVKEDLPELEKQIKRLIK